MTASLTISDPPFSEFSPSYRPSDLNLNGQYQKMALGSSPPSSVAAGKRPQPVSPTEPNGIGHIAEEQPQLIPVAPPIPVQQDYTVQNPWEDTLTQRDNQLRPYDQKPPPGPQPNYYNQPPPASRPFHNHHQESTQTQQIHYDDQRPPAFENQGYDFPAEKTQPFGQIDGAKLSQRPWGEDGRQDAFDDLDDFGPQLPPRPAEQPPPKPPRPAPTFESKEELAKAQKQRSETYQIRQVNWLDATSNTLRQSPVLVQNANGPCPLLALVNAFSLSTPSNVDSALIKALRTREQITLGLLMDAIFDELTSGRRGEFAQDLPDVGDLYKFLVKLHTGMNVNPRFVSKRAPPPNLMDARNSILHLPQGLNSDRKPGDFEETEEIRLYSTFGIPLIHGWMPPRAHESYHALERNAKTYEDAQNILFREEELEDKLSHEGLSQDEHQMLLDIGLIKHFLSSTATQLTGFGLDVISESLYPGAIAIFFRNDHFNTLYKHPLSNQLLTLVTDAGYATHDEIVWESLVDVSGEGCDFFAGDFRPVGNVPPEPSNPSSRRSSRQNNKHQNQASVDSEGFTLVTPRRSSHNRDAPASEPPPQSPAVLQEDADLALALQLQEEEDDRARRASRTPTQRQPGSSMLNPNSSTPNNRLTQTRSHNNETSTPPSIVTSGRRNRAATSQSHPRQGPPPEVRPAIPPRTSRNQGVNRPVDENDDAPPPSYEQAAKGRPYIPPEMNMGQNLDAGPPYAPLDPSPSASSLGLGTTPPYSGGVDDGRRRRPRVNVPGPSSMANMPGGYPGGRYRGGSMTSPVSALDNQRGREREKDCVVM
jgi:ubiquitin carboxyl-terminal hydrolase MINDY-1/2